jgi:hypothetical protein
MAECPYCDYEGEPASVEAHVSAKCDEAHKGKSGAECREEIEASTFGEVDVEESVEVEKANAVPVEAVEEATEGGDGAVTGEPSGASVWSGGWSASAGLLVATLVVAFSVVLLDGSGEAVEEATEGGDGAESEEAAVPEGWT